MASQIRQFNSFRRGPEARAGSICIRVSGNQFPANALKTQAITGNSP